MGVLLKLILAIVSSLLYGYFGCGAQNASQPSFTETQTTIGQKGAKIPLYIGALLPFGGGWDGSGLVPSIDIALEKINERDDILPGYDLQVIWNDTQVGVLFMILLRNV